MKVLSGAIKCYIVFVSHVYWGWIVWNPEVNSYIIGINCLARFMVINSFITCLQLLVIFDAVRLLTCSHALLKNNF